MQTVQCDKSMKPYLDCFFKNNNVIADIGILSPSPAKIKILSDSMELSTPGIILSDYLVVNSDDKELIRNIKGVKANIISCGMSTRATVTLSSIEESSCVFCLQRMIKNLYGNTISPFEIPLSFREHKIDWVSAIMIVTTAIMCGFDTGNIKKIEI